jgi:hypothetical protein
MVNGAWSGRAVQAVHNLALDASQIDWVVKGANDSVVAVVEKVQHVSQRVVEDGPLRKTVFDVIQGRVNEYA